MAVARMPRGVNKSYYGGVPAQDQVVQDFELTVRRVSEAAFGHLTVTVVDGCMEPLIKDGSRVSVRRRRLYWPGDVVVVPGRRGLLVHRVLGWRLHGRRWCVVTAGDRSKTLDDPVPLGRVLGRVVEGDCSQQVLRVPARHRIAALRRFCNFGVAALRRRLGF